MHKRACANTATWQKDESFGISVSAGVLETVVALIPVALTYLLSKPPRLSLLSLAASWMKSWDWLKATRSMFSCVSDIQRAIIPSIHLSFYPLNKNFTLHVKLGPKNADSSIFPFVFLGCQTSWTLEFAQSPSIVIPYVLSCSTL
jgi:hypothetical protein